MGGSHRARWSASALTEALERGEVLVNGVVVAEIAGNYRSLDAVMSRLGEAGLGHREIPLPAFYLAGQAHREYRRRGGSRHRTLPDFFIGAHAAVEGMVLLTRAPRPIRTYFPMVEMIAPC
jgi:hypothetical protein